MKTTTQRVMAGPMVAGGHSLVRRHGEKVMFVEGAIPGETVNVEIIEESKQMVHARVNEIIDASPDRVSPACPLFHEQCGGCEWNYISHQAQIRFKTEIVQDALRRIAKREDLAAEFYASVPTTGYRTTMRMAVRNGRPGMRRRRSHQILDAAPCVITHPLLHPLIIDGRYQSAEVMLRASVGTGQTVVAESSSQTATITERVAGRTFQVSAHSFFQSSPEAASHLCELIDALVPNDVEWIVDAYAGIGILGASLATKRECRVTAIEQNRSAVRDARLNLADYKADIIQAEVADIELFDDNPPDVVVADPARPGLGKSAAQSLAGLGAPLMILISCDPASMARDITLLDALGYDASAVHVLDLFPQTPHVEAVTVFNRR
jgi:23S rRNA (uracil1939-C5)-methyltransferase